eukprot:scaffold10085_cov168-Amphora_coffeaeformis.AAC.1
MKRPSWKVTGTLAIVVATIQQISRSATWFQVLGEVERNHHHPMAHNSNKNDRRIDAQNGGENNVGNKKPTFVMYVGLPKTATSFLQCTLCANWDTTAAILGQDNYKYIGTCPANCGGKGSQEALRHRFEEFFKKGGGAREGGVGPVLHTKTEGDVTKGYHGKP